MSEIKSSQWNNWERNIFYNSCFVLHTNFFQTRSKSAIIKNDIPKRLMFINEKNDTNIFTTIYDGSMT